MNILFLLGTFLGVVAALLLNIGKGVQKQKVHVLLQGRKAFSKPFRSDLLIWVVGLTMTATAGLPFSLGLKFTESPSTVSAMTGVGLVGLTIYAMKVIGERITTKDIIGIGLIVIGTSLLAYVGSGKDIRNRFFEDWSLIKIVAPAFAVIVIACLIALKIKKIHGIIFGISAGFCLGLTIFLADAALVRADGSLSGQFLNPYPYAAIVFAITTTFVTQIGFLRGRALEVVPAINSATILTPIIFEIFIYKVYPELFAMTIVAIIITGVIMISVGAASKVTAPPVSIKEGVVEKTI